MGWGVQAEAAITERSAVEELPLKNCRWAGPKGSLKLVETGRHRPFIRRGTCRLRPPMHSIVPFLELRTYPNILQFVPVLRDLTAMRCLMGQETMGLRPCELIYESIEKQQAMPGWLEEQYEKHNAYVRAKVPKETRLRLRRFALRISRAPSISIALFG